MHTPALAIAWQFWRRHRWGLVASGATLLAMAVAYPFLFALTREPSALLASLLPVVIVTGFLLNALLFVDDAGNLGSGYPRRMFALPVRTHTLVTWPMLYGMGGAALLWLATAALAYRRSGFDTPLLLPALGLAAAMGWLQVISWSPLAVPSARPALAGVLLPALGVPPFWLALTERAAGAAALLVGYLAAAYAVALAGVARARHGEAWGVSVPRPSWWPRARAARRRPFRSAAGAQLWYEWRCHGLTIPAFVAGTILTGEAIPVVITGNVPHTVGSHLIFLVLPLFLVGMLGMSLARVGPFWAPERPSLAFLAVRPMSSGALVVAKFRMAARSVLLTWAVADVGALLMIALTVPPADVAEWWGELRALFPGWKTGAAVVLGAVMLPVVSWRLATEGLAAGLTGRRWVVNLAVAAHAFLLMGGLAVMLWLQFRPDLRPLVDALPWLVAPALAVKLAVAAWAFRAAVARGAIGLRAVRNLFAGWLLFSAAAGGLAIALVPVGAPAPAAVVILGVATVVPLARFGLATLALDWNRYR